MLLLTAIFLEILAGAEMDLFVPSFPVLQKEFAITPFTVELTVGVNFLTHCITALFVGSFADKYGRKPVLIYSLLIFIVGSILCAFAPKFWIILLGRALQGIGISGPAVLAYVIISDKYPSNQIQSRIGIINAAITIAMAFAPVIGCYINMAYGWKGNFMVLLIMGFLSLLLVILFLPKEIKKSNSKFNFCWTEYSLIFKSSKTIWFILCLSFAMQSYYVFIAISPVLYIEDLKVNLDSFALYQGAIAAVFACASLSTGIFISKLGEKLSMIFSSFILLIFFGLSLSIIIMDIKDPLFITISMLFQAVGMAYPVAILWPLSLEAIKGAKGRIGALLVSARLILSTIAISAASYFYNGNYLTIGLTICVTITISLIAGYILIFKHKIFE